MMYRRARSVPIVAVVLGATLAVGCGSDTVSAPGDVGIDLAIQDMGSDEDPQDLEDLSDLSEDVYVPPVVEVDEGTVDRSVRGFRAPAFHDGLIYGVNGTSMLPMVLAIDDNPDQVTVQGFAAAAAGSTVGVVGPDRAFLTTYVTHDPMTPDGIWLWTFDTTTWTLKAALDVGCSQSLPGSRRPLIEDSGRLFLPCGSNVIEIDVTDLEAPRVEAMHAMESGRVWVVSANVSEGREFTVLQESRGSFILERVRIDSSGMRTSQKISGDEGLGVVHDFQWSGDSLWVLTFRDNLVEIDTSGQDFEVGRIIHLREHLETQPEDSNHIGEYANTLAVAGERLIVDWDSSPSNSPAISLLGVFDLSGPEPTVVSEHHFELGPSASRVGLKTGIIHDNAFYLFHNVERGGGAPFTKFSFEEFNIPGD